MLRDTDAPEAFAARDAHDAAKSSVEREEVPLEDEEDEATRTTTEDDSESQDVDGEDDSDIEPGGGGETAEGGLVFYHDAVGAVGDGLAGTIEEGGSSASDLGNAAGTQEAYGQAAAASHRMPGLLVETPPRIPGPGWFPWDDEETPRHLPPILLDDDVDMPGTSEDDTASYCGDEPWAAHSPEDLPERALGPGFFPSQTPGDAAAPSPLQSPLVCLEGAALLREETLLVFDWDDTLLPSTWIQGQGLRLDTRSEAEPWQRDVLADVAASAAEVLSIAKCMGTVVVVTNAERGWIELSCRKFLPALLPIVEGLRTVSARTSCQTPWRTSPVEWKLCAFSAEITRAFGPDAVMDPARRKNIHSLGDSAHEREALMRATADIPCCFAKSLKLVERPGIGEILRQHALVSRCLGDIVQTNSSMDLGITVS